MTTLKEVFTRRRKLEEASGSVCANCGGPLQPDGRVEEGPDDSMDSLKSLKGAKKYAGNIHPADKEKLKSAKGSGDDPTEEQDPEHDQYYSELGRFTFAGRMAKSAKDSEDKHHWNERRGALAKEVDLLAQKFGLPTVKQIHADQD
jgi:hypothetical protein